MALKVNYLKLPGQPNAITAINSNKLRKIFSLNEHIMKHRLCMCVHLLHVYVCVVRVCGMYVCTYVRMHANNTRTPLRIIVY